MNQKAKSRLAKELEGLLKNPISDDKRPIAHKIKLITQNDNLIRHYIDGEFEIFKSAVASGLP